MNREMLKELGLEDEAINKIMAEYGKAINAIKEEKEELENKVDNTNEVEDLKSTYETKIQELENQMKAERVEFNLRTALEKEGAVDTDYLIYKLGDLSELKTDDKGTILEIDNIVSTLKASNESMFSKENTLEIVENKIDTTETPLTMADVEKMTAEEINENWEQIQNINLGGDK